MCAVARSTDDHLNGTIGMTPNPDEGLVSSNGHKENPNVQTLGVSVHDRQDFSAATGDQEDHASHSLLQDVPTSDYTNSDPEQEKSYKPGITDKQEMALLDDKFEKMLEQYFTESIQGVENNSSDGSQHVEDEIEDYCEAALKACKPSSSNIAVQKWPQSNRSSKKTWPKYWTRAKR